jgi:hypothetical protein
VAPYSDKDPRTEQRCAHSKQKNESPTSGALRLLRELFVCKSWLISLFCPFSRKRVKTSARKVILFNKNPEFAPCENGGFRFVSSLAPTVTWANVAA